MKSKLCFFLLSLLMLPLIASAEGNNCVDCHTTGRKLVQITRKIAKTRPAQKGSIESVGEG